MNVLEEFWYGNLDPAEYDACPDEEYKELIRLIMGHLQAVQYIAAISI